MGYRIVAGTLLVIAGLSLRAIPSAAQTGGSTMPPDTTAAAAASSMPADSTKPATVPPAAAAVPPAAAATPAPAATTAPPPATPPPAQTAPPPKAKSASDPSPFARGKTQVTLTAGWGRSFQDDYLLLGIGLGRYIKTGLELALDYELWIGSDPGVSKLSPEINYVLTRSKILTPYVGAFYTRTYIENADDLDSVGGRVGVYRARGRTSIGVGGVYENYLDCNDAVYGTCSDWYPEIFVSSSF